MIGGFESRKVEILIVTQVDFRTNAIKATFVILVKHQDGANQVI